MKYSVLIINLDKSTKRLNFMKEQCNRLNLTFNRISAIRGDSLSVTEKSKVYDLVANECKYSKVLNDGEIGCYLSHVACWENIIDNNLDFALILEDDAILSDSMIPYIQQVKKLPQTWDYIKLSHGSKVKKTLDKLVFGGNLSINECLKLPSTTTGQFVSREGAKKLLATAFPICRPVDMDIQHWYEKDLKCFVAKPFPVKDACLDSEINKTVSRLSIKSKRFKSMWLKLKYEFNLLIHRYQYAKITSIK